MSRVGAVEDFDDGAAVHDGDAVAHPQDFGKLRRDHQDGDALGGEVGHQRVYLRLRAHVDALRRLVDDEHLRSSQKPTRQGDLLLVAAGERGDGDVDGRRLHAEPARVVAGNLALALKVDPRAAGDLVERGERDVRADLHVEDDPVPAPVFGQVGDAAPDGLARAAYADALAAKKYLAGVYGRESEARARQLRPPRADEPR